MKTIEILVAEIGSTTTIVNAFSSGGDFLGRGVALTSVESDVRHGLDQAIKNLNETTGYPLEDVKEMLATSSAAGGLRMSVHGLVYDMTVKAAREAASNAGANIHLITAGDLEADELEQIKDLRPNIVLLAGGTDYGEKRVAFDNLKRVMDLRLSVPLIYAGNVENHYRIEKFAKKHEQGAYLSIVENVYPRVDDLNITPVRERIYEVFEDHIVEAKGMRHVRDRVTHDILPTPGAVMDATELLHAELGNLVVLDVGGATTDVHSITEPSEEFASYLEGEPLAKRTVEGDLGVYSNRGNILSLSDEQRLAERIGVDASELETLAATTPQIPRDARERSFIYELTRLAVHEALDRHIGDRRRVFTSSGRKVVPDGRDLTRVGAVVMTGGALVNLSDTAAIVHEYFKERRNKLIPEGSLLLYKDHDYIMASIGALSRRHPKRALSAILGSLKAGD